MKAMKMENEGKITYYIKTQFVNTRLSICVPFLSVLLSVIYFVFILSDYSVFSNFN